ncbi:MAG: DUF1963 domain-containing protein [Actinobacteria bacterium]|nr:MAG: DUF1963 domain-containing protein [Actinomycetota bacterium]
MPDRRRFFKELLREAASVAQEVSSALRPEEEPEEEWRPPPPVAARPATERVDVEELLELSREAGLEARAEDVRRLARVGIRLTPAPAEGDQVGRTRLGGLPDLPRGVEWPARDGRELAFVGQVNLAHVAAVNPEAPLPREGLLLFFYDLGRRPRGVDPADRGSCRVLYADDLSELEPHESRAPHLRALPVELSRELQLPGAWSLHGEALELTYDESTAWDELRERLAAAQGVELDDTSPDRVALHRLLGYHEEFGREVEIDCELAATGVDADDDSTYYDQRVDHEAQAREWRLLLQLSADESLGTPRDEFDRLYICIRDEDLRAGRFDGAWAIRR